MASQNYTLTIGSTGGYGNFSYGFSSGNFGSITPSNGPGLLANPLVVVTYSTFSDGSESVRLAVQGSHPRSDLGSITIGSTTFTESAATSYSNTGTNTEWRWTVTSAPMGTSGTVNVTIQDSVPSITAPTVNDTMPTHVVAGTASSTTTVDISLSSSGSGGTLEYNVSTSTSVPTSGWTTGNPSVTRGTAYYLWARRSSTTNDRSASTLTIPYISPDTSITTTWPTGSLASSATTFTVGIANGSSTTTYSVRTGSYSGTVVGSRTGDGNITVSDTPSSGGSKTYYLTAHVVTGSGGNGNTSNIESVSVSKQLASTGVNHTVTTTLDYIPGEPGTPATYSTQVSPSTLNVTEGDTVTFVLNNTSGFSSNLSVGSFDSGKWTSTAGLTVTTTSTGVKTVLGSSGSDVVTITPGNTNFPGRSVTFNFQSATDNTPDSFNLGTNITSANINTQFALNTVTVSGISSTASIPASITNGIFSVNDSSGASANSSTKNVSVNDKIYTFVTSSSSYSTAKTVTLNINGVTDSLTVTTKAAPPSPQDGIIIPLGVSSGAISMETLRNFFGETSLYVETISLSDLYKGGDLVPNITQNSAVPSSGTISLDDFYGSATSLYIENPLGYYSELGGSSSAGTAVLLIDMNATSGGDVSVGYGAIRRSEGLQYRFIVNSSIADTGDPFTTEVYPSFIRIGEGPGDTYTNPGAAWTGPWQDDVIDLEIGLDYGIEDSLLARGTVTLEVRKTWNSVEYSTSTTGSWQIQVIDDIN